MKNLIYVTPETRNKQALIWLLRTAVKALNLRNVVVDEVKHGGYRIIAHEVLSFDTHLSDIDLMGNRLSPAALTFDPTGVITVEDKQDLLLTAFYLINCLQEYGIQTTDAIGRFRYEDSYQYRYQKADQNFVTHLFERYFRQYFPEILENRVEEKSVFFLSHDIDSLFGALLQDGKAALKNGRLDVIVRLILNVVVLKPDWFNIDKILEIESEYDLRSTFFWIVNKGRVNGLLTNADYNIRSKRIQDTLAQVIGNGNTIGIHKSISDETFNDEIKKLNKHIVLNRNHYLRFTLPRHFDDLEASHIKIDCSLGFAEQYGFRNSLAIPFVPFNLKENKPFSFLEIPLNIMDGTFQKYMMIRPEDTSGKMIEFIEKNRVNSVISVLWHNHFFSSYRFRGYFEPYEDLLFYIKEKKFEVRSPGQLFNKYFHLK